MTYPAWKVDHVIVLAGFGLNHSEIARATGVSRERVRTWLKGDTSRTRGGTPCWACAGRGCPNGSQYSYLLGLYLGDGTISAARGHKGVWKLRIFQDERYLRLIGDCITAIEAVLPNPAGVQQRLGCVEIYAHSKHWPCLFPQHGPGRKHERAIALQAWQQQLVDAHPRELLRGLIHSDGSRHVNCVVTRGKPYEYARYNFSNASADIRRIFTDTRDALGVHWTQMNERNVAVSRRADVEFLDTFIGPKS